MVWVVQRNRTNRRYRYIEMIEMEIYYKELAYAVVLAVKSQALQPASWTPRRTDDVVPVQGRESESQESQDVSSSTSPTIKEREDPCPHSEGENSP